MFRLGLISRLGFEQDQFQDLAEELSYRIKSFSHDCYQISDELPSGPYPCVFGVAASIYIAGLDPSLIC